MKISIYSLINKQRGLSIPGVTPVVPPSNFDGLIIEEVRHLRLWVPIHKPEQVHIVALDSVLRVIFLTKKFGGLGIAIMWGTFNIEVFREVGRRFWSKVNTRI